LKEERFLLKTNQSYNMRKLIMKMSMSLDGFVSGLNGQNDWIFKTGDEQSKAWSVGILQEAGQIIMGRKSYEGWAQYWPTAPGPFAAPMNEIPKWVFSKKGFKRSDSVETTTTEQSPAAASWAEARIFSGDLAEGVRKLKAESGKPILALGGAGFMRSLIETGLIDEYHLPIHPLALGAGLPIFSDLSSPLYLKLADVKTFPGGIVVHTYHPA
jgi:dihydrofolate reductase